MNYLPDLLGLCPKCPPLAAGPLGAWESGLGAPAGTPPDEARLASVAMRVLAFEAPGADGGVVGRQ